ncbi:MAG: argininosuccinate lyase [Flavobacteriaceae bacterium]
MKLWQKKSSSIDDKIEAFTVGDDRLWDQRLIPYDLKASAAHAQMLGEVGLISQAEAQQLQDTLAIFSEEYEAGTFVIEEQFEDMHSKIEFELIERLGDTGKKIHLARSRNDQVLVALQLYFKDAISTISEATAQLFERLIGLADEHQEVALPGYTHLQIAMPSSFGLWFSAYAESLIDDLQILAAAQRVNDQNPLGSAAGYGSSFPIDRKRTTELMAFETLKYNVVAAQMSRGKIEKILAQAMANIAETLSRFAADICLYMSQNMDFISFPEDITTGSSIMPHKKNPDVFELIRGKCNSLQALPNQLTLMKTNLPSGYHREMQLFKGPILAGIDQLLDCLTLLEYSLKNIRVRTDILEDPMYQYLFTVDAINTKIQSGIPFRDAYQQVGDAVNQGQFEAPEGLHHTHEGSLGNLCLTEIKQKFENLYREMNSRP